VKHDITMNPSPKDPHELRAEFLAEADARYRDFLDSGRGIPWEKMKTWLLAYAAGETPAKPVAEPLPDDVMRALRAEYHHP